MAQTDEMAHEVAALLKPAINDFRYFKSFRQLRKKTKQITDDIIVSVTTPGGGNPYTIVFYFGVQYTQVESIIADIENRKISAYNRTIFQNSYNISPSRDMNFEGDAVWNGLKSIDHLETISKPIQDFITGFVVPYHQKFHNLSTTRKHLALNDGWILNHKPYKQVLVIDSIEGASDRAEAYLEKLQGEKDSGHNWDPVQFNSFYSALRTVYPNVLPSFELM